MTHRGGGSAPVHAEDPLQSLNGTIGQLEHLVEDLSDGLPTVTAFDGLVAEPFRETEPLPEDFEEPFGHPVGDSEVLLRQEDLGHIRRRGRGGTSASFPLRGPGLDLTRGLVDEDADQVERVGHLVDLGLVVGAPIGLGRVAVSIVEGALSRGRDELADRLSRSREVSHEGGKGGK